jgi:hypothetical protein
VQQRELQSAQNWQLLFDPVDIDTSQLTSLSTLADVSRGILTGENDFFCLSQTDVAETGIEDRYLSQLAPGPRHVDGFDLRETDWDRLNQEGADVWLLYHLESLTATPEPLQDAREVASEWPESIQTTVRDTGQSSPNLIAYLRFGLTEHETVSERSTIVDRATWYLVSRKDPAPILVPYMARGQFRAILNEIGARHVNNYHGIYPAEWMDSTQLKALLAYLNSEFVNDIVSQHERTQADGLNKLEPSDLEHVDVIDPRQLDDRIVAELAEAFDELRQSARQGTEDGILEEIDGILRRELTSEQ